MILSKRSILLILFSTLMINTAGMALYTYMPRYLEYLGTQISLIPLIISIFALTSVIFPPLIGRASDKIQNRKIFALIGSIGVLIVFILLFFTDALWLISIYLFLYGLSAACLGMLLVLYAELSQNEKRFISFFNAIVALGWFFGAFFCGIFIDNYGIENLYWFMLLFTILNFIPVIFIKEDRKLILESNDRVMAKQIGDNYIIDSSSEIAPISNSIYPALMFRNFGLRPVLSIMAIIMALHLSSDAEIGLLVGANPLIQFFLIIIIGELITDNNIKHLMVLGYILSAVTIIGYIFSTNFIGFLISQILLSLSYSMFWTTTQVYVTKNTTPVNKGKYVGYVNTSFYLGSFLGAFLFSFLLEIFSDYYIAMYFMIIFPAISSLVLLAKFSEIKQKKFN